MEKVIGEALGELPNFAPSFKRSTNDQGKTVMNVGLNFQFGVIEFVLEEKNGILTVSYPVINIDVRKTGLDYDFVPRLMTIINNLIPTLNPYFGL